MKKFDESTPSIDHVLLISDRSKFIWRDRWSDLTDEILQEHAIDRGSTLVNFFLPPLCLSNNLPRFISIYQYLSLSPLCRYEDRPRWRRNGRRRRLSWELTRRDGGAEARLRRSLALPGETIRRGGGRPQNNGCTVRIFASLGWGEREREHREREKQLSFLLSFPPTLSCQEGGNLSLSLSLSI